MGVSINVPLLNMMGEDDDPKDDVCERMLKDVIRPYFVEAGKIYRDGLYSEISHCVEVKCDFENSDSRKVIDVILEEIDNASKSQTITLDEARKIVLERLGIPEVPDKNNGYSFSDAETQVNHFIGKMKNWFNELNGSAPQIVNKDDECVDVGRSDKEIAIEKMEFRLRASSQKIVNAIRSDSDRGYVSIDKLRNFMRNGNYKDSDLHTIAYDIQFYQMLKDYGSVRSYIMKPIVDSLRESIKSEIDAIEDYTDEEC